VTFPAAALWTFHFLRVIASLAQGAGDGILPAVGRPDVTDPRVRFGGQSAEVGPLAEI
jgi:hypothetical protein